VLELLSVTPATVVVPLVSAAFRAVMGRSRLTVHVSGRTGTGKSLLAGIVQPLFGRGMHGEALPVSWADGSTANGIARVLSRVSDAPVVVDDLRFGGGPSDVRVAELFDRVTRAQFNGAAPVKLTRDGGQRTDPASRCIIVSTGETPPRMHSTRNRVVCVELDERSAPDLAPLVLRAAGGELARGMAAFVQWYAPRYATNLPRLDALERAAGVRWALGVTDRAASLFRALALGAELLFAWLAEADVAPPSPPSTKPAPGGARRRGPRARRGRRDGEPRAEVPPAAARCAHHQGGAHRRDRDGRAHGPPRRLRSVGVAHRRPRRPPPAGEARGVDPRGGGVHRPRPRPRRREGAGAAGGRPPSPPTAPPSAATSTRPGSSPGPPSTSRATPAPPAR